MRLPIKKITISSIALIVVGLVWPAVALSGAEDGGLIPQEGLLITVIQPGWTNHSDDEYVEVYNAASQAVDVTGWKLQYVSISNESPRTEDWSTTATLSCAQPYAPSCRVIVASGSRLVLARGSFLPQSESRRFRPLDGTKFATSTGRIQLINLAGQTVDRVDYGDKATAGTTLANTKNKDSSRAWALRRMQDETGAYRVASSSNTFIDNYDEFSIDSAPDTGWTDDQAVEVATTYSGLASSPDLADVTQIGEESSAQEPTVFGENSEAVFITELLPDPASPQEDKTDEFVELYNPNPNSILLHNFVIETGSDWRYKYTIQDVVLAPESYIVFRSLATGLTLSNSGGAVRLLGPDGELIDEVSPYAAAKPGESWSKLDDGGWQWSTSPSPGEPNVIVAPLASAAATSAAAKKTSTTKKTTTAKAKATKPKTTTSSKNKTVPDNTPYTKTEPSATQPRYWLIASVAGLAGLYALYEYRYECRNTLRRCIMWVRARRAPT